MTPQGYISLTEMAQQLGVSLETLVAAADTKGVARYQSAGALVIRQGDAAALAAALQISSQTPMSASAPPDKLEPAGRKPADESDILGILSDDDEDDEDPVPSRPRIAPPASPVVSPRMGTIELVGQSPVPTGLAVNRPRPEPSGPGNSDSGLFNDQEIKSRAAAPPETRAERASGDAGVSAFTPQARSGTAPIAVASAPTSSRAPDAPAPMGSIRYRPLAWPAGLLAPDADELALTPNVLEPSPAIPVPGNTAHRISNDRQLLIDPAIIDTNRGAELVLNRPVKHHVPVLQPDAPWEQGGLCTLSGSVLRDPRDGLIKMWYHTVLKGGTRAACLATSTDGLNWTKPALNVYTHEGTPTNVVMTHPVTDSYAELCGVIFDPAADPAQQYKALYQYQNIQTAVKALKTATSADGIHWNTSASPPLTQISDTSRLTRDPRTGHYIIYGRLNRQGRRCVQRIDSEDFLFWGAGEPVLEPDANDPPGDDLYALGAFPYGRGWVGLLQVFHGPPHFNLDCQLVTSSDGWKWDRPAITVGVPGVNTTQERIGFLPLGTPGYWDRHQISPADRPLAVGQRELWIYYGGRVQRHAPYSGPDRGTAWGAIGVASVRTDGFGHLQATFEGATVVTQPLLFSHPELRLNLNSAYGQLQVQLLDADMRPMDGMMSRPIVADSTNAAVVWANPRPLTQYKDRPMRLRFTFKNAKLYAFWTQPLE